MHKRRVMSFSFVFLLFVLALLAISYYFSGFTGFVSYDQINKFKADQVVYGNLDNFLPSLINYEKIDNKLKVHYSLTDYTGNHQEILVNFYIKDNSDLVLFSNSEKVILGANKQENYISYISIPHDFSGSYLFVLEANNGNEINSVYTDLFISSRNVTGYVISDENKQKIYYFVIAIIAILFVYYLFGKMKQMHRKAYTEIVVPKKKFIKLELD